MSIDPFDPSLTRRRAVDWQDSAIVRQAAHGRTGLEIMRGIRDGTLPGPPIARLMDFRVAVAEPGEIAMELDPHESLENPAGLLHGAVAAALLDTAMGACVHTLLPADKISVTLDLKITYLRPLTTASGRLRASGRLLNLGGRSAYVEGDLRNGAGELAAHAVGNFSIVNVRS
jgi:uncharacterized protein (TIGR00369 family)